MYGRSTALAISVALLSACGRPEEAPRVELPVVVDASGVTTVTTDLGYTVELVEARMVIRDLVFSVAGEVHATGLWSTIADFLLPTAVAHPGHFQGGEVTGELRGRFLLDFVPGNGDVELGTATLLVGAYESVNFVFERAEDGDGLDADDPLLGHTALLRGHASKDENSIAFTAVIDSPEGRELTGAPFSLEVTEASRQRLGIRFLTEDPFEGDTVF
ncbi:MAG TPA: hypothetical protein VKY73_19060, partial [Polyangiaceae bacterium]|nr:hypothetical protein [Polyangiaceae bacterium]